MQDARAPHSRLWDLIAPIGRRTSIARDLAAWADIQAVPALATLAALNCLAVMVLVRKFGNGAPVSLTNLRLCIGSLAAALLATGSRWQLSRLELRPPALPARMLLGLASVFPLIVLFTAITGRHSPWAISLVSALVVATWSTVLTWRTARDGSDSSLAAPEADGEAPPFGIGHSSELNGASSRGNRAEPASPPRTVPVDEALREPDATEWIERAIDRSGRVTLRGRIVVSFAAGQTLVTAHIPFSPPLGSFPEFSCEVVDDPSVRARPAVFRYGVRLELRRSGDVSAPQQATLRFHAASSTAALRAA